MCGGGVEFCFVASHLYIATFLVSLPHCEKLSTIQVGAFLLVIVYSYIHVQLHFELLLLREPTKSFV